MKMIDKIFNNKLILFFIIFILIKPGIFSENVDCFLIGRLIDFFRIIVSLFCGFVFFSKKLKLNKTYFLILYYLVLLFFTIVNKGDIFSLLIQTILTLDWIVIFHYNMEYNRNNFFDILEHVFICLIIINFMTILFYPNGMYVNTSKYYSNYFLGFDNNHIVFLFVGITISFINSYRKYGYLKGNAILIYLISLLTVVFNWSATSLIVFFIFSFLVLFIKKFYKKIIEKKRLILLVFVFALLFILIFISSGLYKYFIVNVLKKDLTFSNRIFIWKDYLELIKNNVFYGYGNVHIEFILSKTNALHAHNLYINILYQGGILLLLVFLYILYSFWPRTDNKNNKSLTILNSILISFLISFLFESYNLMPLFFVILLLNYYLDIYGLELKYKCSENKELYYFVKRSFDIIISLFGCLSLIIITPIVKLLYIINGDYDTIFYTQTRIGKNGKYFKLYKYRTMNKDSEKILKKILKDKKIKEEWEKNQKLKNDPRVTKIGKILRNTCIDEFPQFFNVLKGDMAIIGPRPYLVREKKYLKSNLKKIVIVEPGISGYWQVTKVDNPTFSSRIKCDIFYVENISFNFDLKIFFKTLLLFIKR